MTLHTMDGSPVFQSDVRMSGADSLVSAASVAIGHYGQWLLELEEQAERRKIELLRVRLASVLPSSRAVVRAWQCPLVIH